MEGSCRCRQTTMDSISIIIFLAFWPLILYPFTKWVKCVCEGIRIHFIERYYWSRVNKHEVSCNLSLLLTPELFDGPSKCIRLSQSICDFSDRHKKTLVDAVMHNKDIGTITLRKKRDNYAVYYHEVVDGNSRLIALHDYMNDKFSWNHKRFSELSGEKRLFFREYKIGIRIIDP